MKIVVCAKDVKEREALSAGLPTHTIVYTESLYDVVAHDDVDCLCVFVKVPVGATEMDWFPNVRGIVTRSTGFDHIDVVEARKRNIVVSNVPAYGEHTIAEYAFAMLLALSRRICETDRQVRIDGLYTTEGLDGFDLAGKKMGIVGTGHTGEHAIRIARGFGMDVVAYDVVERKHLEAELSFMYVTLPDLLAQSDVISLHAPYNAHTHHLINMETARGVKRGAYLINTARGGLVDTRALIAMLEDGILAGAGLDVVEEEAHMNKRAEVLVEEAPDRETLRILLANQYLIDHPRVLIMPHNAFNTHEAFARILQTTIGNIEAIARGAPQNVV